MNNYNKYLKYKHKYYALKKQIGGAPEEFDPHKLDHTEQKNTHLAILLKPDDIDIATFIKSLIKYYILNVHVNEKNHLCPDIKKYNIPTLNNKAVPELVLQYYNIDEELSLQEILAYTYEYTPLKGTVRSNQVASTTIIPCNEKGYVINDNIITTIRKKIIAIKETINESEFTISNIVHNLQKHPLKDIYIKLNQRYNDNLQLAKSKNTAVTFSVYFSDIIHWYWYNTLGNNNNLQNHSIICKNMLTYFYRLTRQQNPPQKEAQKLLRRGTLHMSTVGMGRLHIGDAPTSISTTTAANATPPVLTNLPKPKNETYQ